LDSLDNKGLAAYLIADELSFGAQVEKTEARNAEALEHWPPPDTAPY
jgi:hypothetical protein